MAILTATEAAQALNYSDVAQMPEKVTGILVPGIDSYIEKATGRDWGTLTTDYIAIDPVAKTVAAALLSQWFIDPATIGTANGLGIVSMLGQLEAAVLQESQAAV
jgi:hypothetical protein